MSWADPTGDLRRLLADTSDDNTIKDQRAIPQGNGVTWLTFYDRLAASGVQSLQPDPRTRLRAFLSGTELNASGINVTDATRGEFTVMGALGSNPDLRLSYHYQQFRDDELSFFLQQAANEVSVDLIGNTAPGLQSAALNFAVSLAHDRLATRWNQRKLDQFALHEIGAMGEQANELVKYHQERATTTLARAHQLRRDYYDYRKDRGRSPAFGVLKRTPRFWGPNR